MTFLLRLFLVVLVTSSAPAMASAEPTAQERADVRAAIESQLAAFARDDGEAAYAVAAEPIRRLFGTPEAFMAMVKSGYAPIYRPKTVVFGPILDGAAGPEQEVLITDLAGVDWIARYDMTRDAEGRWRIQGCRLVRNERDAA